ncbi:MAG: SRPBCC family protein [Calditrichaeota bacterium]|nr:MAG: SRPBCC family protein [Calditrichota bacterium]
MVNVKVSGVIQGDPKKVWELINDVERFPEWMPGVVDAKIISNSKRRKNGLGRRQLLKTEMKLGKGETLQEVIVWDPPHRVTWEHLKDVVDGKEFSHAKEIRTTLSITNVDGEVNFRMIGSWQPVGVSGQLMTRVMKRTVTRNFEQALKNLQKILSREKR